MNRTPSISFGLPETVVVSGAASGFGAALSERLRQAGSHVVGLDVAPGAGPDDVVGDVTSLGSWEHVRDVAVANGPSSLGLVTCAAILEVGTATTHPIDAWRKVIDVNLTGTLLGLRAMIPAMIELGGGPIVALGSVDALHAEQELASYCASKAGVYQLARTTALDFGRDGIRVNVLSPGPMDVGLFRRHLHAVDDPGLRATRTARQPNGRILDPAEVVSTAAFMLSDGATGMTGTEVMVDGGLTTGYEFRLD
jgi:NAD(P)-dependent dehydrogenase (short-subunit alcohol dehydrogenase family)